MTNRYDRIAYIFIALGFFLRLGYVQFINPIERMIYSDMANYVQISDSILRGEWRVTHFFQPIGFPYLLVVLKILFLNWLGILEWLQLFTATATLWFLWRTAKESMGERIGLYSLIVASIHLSWISFVGLILSENIFIFLLSILAWVSLKLVRTKQLKYAVLWAVTFFLAFLIKGTHVFIAPLFVLSAFYFQRKTSVRYLTLLTVIVCAGLIGHGLFTKEKIGKFQMSASAGGLNFVEGKCPMKNNADSAGYSWLSPLYNQLGLNAQKKWNVPFTDSGYYMKEGLKCMRQNPFVLIQSFEGIPFLFVGNTLWPANQTIIAQPMRLFEQIFGCFSIIGLAVFFVFLRRDENLEEDIMVWVVPVAAVFLCVYIFKSEIRFRIPFDVWIIPVAVKGWSDLFRARLNERPQL